MKLLLSILLLIGIAVADDWSRAMEAFLSGDKLQAASLFKKESQRGNEAAQAMLGDMYYEGDILKKDCKKVIKWLKNPASQGNSKAQLTLAKCYMEQKHFSDGIYWLKKASNANRPQAYTILANIYIYGVGVEKDERKGLEYLELAVKNNDKEATVILALAHAKGILGLKANPQNAVDLLHSTANFDPKAQYYLGLIYGMQLHDAHKGYKWLKKSADNNFAPSQFYLAKVYVQQKEFYKAEKLFLKAAHNDVTPSRCQMLPTILDFLGNSKEKIELVKNLLLEVDKDLKIPLCKQVWDKYKLAEF